MERADKAVALKHNGNNCCQAVLMAYEDELKVPAEQLRQLGAAFGAGMGCAEGTCGALCGAQMVLGLKTFDGKPIMKDAKAVLEQFRAKSGGTICKVLKGIETGVVLSSCDDNVRHAVEVLEERA